MYITESQLRSIIRRIILESEQVETEDSEEEEEPMGDEASKLKAAYGLAKEVGGML